MGLHLSLNLLRNMRQSQKNRIQQQLIQRTIVETWQRLQYLVDRVPDDADCEQDEEARNNVLNVWAIEEEWIVDPRQRAELSMIQMDDDE
jgi:hypothetical protein